MPGKKEARLTWKSGRATVCKDDQIIPQDEWERKCWGFVPTFVLAGILWLVWEAITPCLS